MKPKDFKDLIKTTIDDHYDSMAKTGIVTKTSFSPSSLYSHGRCARYWYFALSGEEWEDTATAQSRRIMESGTQRHESLQKALEPVLESVEEELTYDDPPIRGFCDLTIMYNGQKIPGEIKTARTLGYEKRVRLREVPPYQLGQLLLYMHMLGVDRGFFLLENADSKEVEVILVRMTDARREWVEYALEWYRQVYDAHEKNLLPSHNYRKNASICKQCPFRKQCEALGKQGDIDIPEMRLPE